MSVTSENDAYELKLSTLESTVLAAFTLLQILVGSIANFIVIITIIVTRQLRNRSEDRLIFSLAVADFLSSTAFLPCLCYLLIQRKISKNLLMFCGPLSVLLFSSGGNAILSIAIDRVTCVQFPLRHKKIMTRRTTSIMVVISWGITVVLVITDFLRLASILDYNNLKILLITYDFFLQLGIVVLYSIIFHCTVIQSRKILNQRRSVGIEDHDNSSRLLLKATKTTLALAGLYCLTMLPITIYTLYAVATETSVESNLNNVYWFYSFALLNSCFDPFVYALRTKRFRAAFYRKIWSKILRKNGPPRDPRQFSVPSIR